MEQIIINKKSGDRIRLFSYYNGSGITKAEQVCELLGQDVVNISVKSAIALRFDIGDYVELFGSRYTMNAVPVERKKSDRNFEYDLKFEGAQYEMIKVIYLDIDNEGMSTGTNFFLMGNLRDFADLLIRNMERVYGEGKWTLGDCPEDTLMQNVQFTNNTCLQVLQDMCDKYEVAFFIDRVGGDEYVIHLRKPETIVDFVFKYGRTRGLYSLERLAVDGKSLITRLFAFGAAKNLPLDYRYGSTRLKMPLAAIHDEGQPYIEDVAAIERYDVVEGIIEYDDIFPERTGTVTAIDYTDPYIFFDTSMPFDLAASEGGSTLYLIPGMTAKVVFKTGNLAGYEFDISSEGGYDHDTKKFKILPYVDDRGMSFPSETESTFQIQVGDRYVLTDIMMPPEYIADAENRLLLRAQDFLSKNSVPQIKYGLTIDQNFIRSRVPENVIVNYFKLGDYLMVYDEDLRINGRVPIQGFTRDILKHYNYNLTLGDEYISRSGPISRLRAAIRADRSLLTTAPSRRYYTFSTTIVEPERRMVWSEVSW